MQSTGRDFGPALFCKGDRVNISIVARVAAVFLVLTGCASQASVTAPEVELMQTSGLPNTRVESASGLPMEFQLKITNPLNHPVTLVAVEVESVGQTGAYEMKRVRHSFDRTIAANATDTIDLRAWVQPLQVDVRGTVNSPVMLRGTARFETPAGVLRRNFVGRGQ